METLFRLLLRRPAAAQSEETVRRVINPERALKGSHPSPPATQRTRVIQRFHGCAGLGRVTQGSSVQAGLVNLATRGLSDAILLGLRNRRGLAGNARSPLRLLSSPKNNAKSLACLDGGKPLGPVTQQIRRWLPE